jgi:glycosyltransferase involved in cell wall biosynthesis
VTAVAFLTPVAGSTGRGNATTVERIARGLAERGVTARVWDLSATTDEAVRRGIVADRPRLVHGFHVLHSGPLALELADRLQVPSVVTLTGTDANHDLVDAERAATVARVLAGAAAVTTFHPSITARVVAALPAVASRVVEIAQAVRFDGTEPLDLGARWALPADRVLVLFAGGIRAVKRPRLVLRGLEPVAARHAELRLAYAGPIIEQAEADALCAALRTRPWARYLGDVPRPQMASLLGQADVVVNGSQSEGGMANAVLEALALGRAVLAADIEGNRSVVEHDVTGLLFRDEAGLTGQAERLVSNAQLRARLGAAGRARIARDHPPDREIDAYLALYRSLGVGR